jgi:hypothetical protein
MSTMTDATTAPERDRSAGIAEGDRARFWISMVVTALVLAFSVVQVLNLLQVHTVGPEIYGVGVAVLAVAAGVLSMGLLASRHKRVIATLAVLALWALIAIGGVGGVVAHIVGPGEGHGPVDSRPRPVAAPLIFTAIGVVAGAALFYGRRPGLSRDRASSGK